MLVTISTTHQPATDLGYLLHKHPDRVQRFRQSFGTATVLYPEAGEERCTAALVLEVDPVRLARSSRESPDFTLSQYVNDRSYAASSLLGVALADVFSTARSGRCDARQELADRPIPLEIGIPALPCRGGPEIAHRLFAPLGWDVEARPVPLDERFPEWGDSRYVTLRLIGDVRVADALNQLHVLLPVLDESKHYWQGTAEVDKLLRSGGGWLETHPDRDLVVRRYLGRRASLTKAAFERLAELGDDTPDAGDPALEEQAEESPEAVDAAEVVVRRRPLVAQRHDAVLDALRELGARSVIDLGCGSGKLLAALLADPSFARVAGTDVSARSLQQAARALRLDRRSEREAGRVRLFQSALTYEDHRLQGYDAAVLMEVVEHVDPPRLPALERVVFGRARPQAVLVTTPNVEFNPNFDGLTGFRHPDHRFEWSRAEFTLWCDRVAAGHGYTVEQRGIGEVDPERGTPTQMGVFRRG